MPDRVILNCHLLIKGVNIMATPSYLYSRLLNDSIGFNRDSLLNLLGEKTTHSAFPPYNIIDEGNNKYRVELALAGYREEDLSIEHVENKLIITGEQEISKDRQYLFKGIAERNFRRDFILADHVVVESAEFKNGVLSVYLKKIVPEEKLPKKIAINKLLG